MSILAWLGAFIGSVATSPWTQWWNRGIGPAPTPQGTPPIDFSILNQAQLLAQFSDAIGPNGITPRSLRNLVGSTITPNVGGTWPSYPFPLPGWTTSSRPTGMQGPVVGFNYTLRQLDLWDDELGEWINPTFSNFFVPAPTNFNAHVQMNAGANINGGAAIQGPITVWLPTAPGPSGTLWRNGNTVSVSP